MTSHNCLLINSYVKEIQNIIKVCFSKTNFSIQKKKIYYKIINIKIIFKQYIDRYVIYKMNDC